MFGLPPDGFIVSKIESKVIRRCPFCVEEVGDEAGKDINFIVHMGAWTQKHQMRKEWADYITRLNHPVF